jgi:hypothetical protein
MHAYVAIRDQPCYRRDCFVRGLANLGYKIAPMHLIGKGQPGDVLVIWNRYGVLHETAARFEREGGRVLVAENGYIGLNRKDRRVYALAISGHNGQGRWHYGGPQRWARMGIQMRPWRTTGNHILVMPNRNFGCPGYIMPSNWSESVVDRLKRVTRRPVVVRPHPGNDLPKRALALDLANAWCAIIWSSSAGCEALLAGIPVIAECPKWICKAATPEGGIKLADNPPLIDRTPAFERLAWAQWTVEEIELGLPFQYLRD